MHTKLNLGSYFPFISNETISLVVNQKITNYCLHLMDWLINGFTGMFTYFGHVMPTQIMI